MSEPSTVPATRSVRIPADVADALETRRRATSFETLDAYVAFVLARLVEEPGAGAFTEDDERQLKEKLRSLGYID
jgi:hypothetical protein